MEDLTTLGYRHLVLQLHTRVEFEEVVVIQKFRMVGFQMGFVGFQIGCTMAWVLED